MIRKSYQVGLTFGGGEGPNKIEQFRGSGSRFSFKRVGEGGNTWGKGGKELRILKGGFKRWGNIVGKKLKK